MLAACSLPAPHREIQASDEGDEIVYHDDLLMLRRSKRQAVIEAKANAATGAGAEFFR